MLSWSPHRLQTYFLLNKCAMRAQVHDVERKSAVNVCFLECGLWCSVSPAALRSLLPAARSALSGNQAQDWILNQRELAVHKTWRGVRTNADSGCPLSPSWGTALSTLQLMFKAPKRREREKTWHTCIWMVGIWIFVFLVFYALKAILILCLFLSCVLTALLVCLFVCLAKFDQTWWRDGARDRTQ